MKIISVTAQPHVFITLPVEALIEAGITPTDAVKVVIHKLQPEDIESFECDEDCVNCPFRIIDCAHEKAV